MSEPGAGKIEIKDLPWYYRVIMRIPGANILADVSSGIFWAIVVPIFLMAYFFLNIFLLISFSFPTNILLTAVIPTVMLIMFVRISLERFIVWWNGAFAGLGHEWNVQKAVDEYLAKIKKKEEHTN